MYRSGKNIKILLIIPNVVKKSKSGKLKNKDEAADNVNETAALD